MKQATLPSEELKSAAVSFQQHLQEAERIRANTTELMKQAAAAAERVAADLRTDVILVVNAGTEASLQITAGERTLTLVPLAGVAYDARLPKPKGKLCAEMVIFGHMSDQESGTLLSCLRIYADGYCSNGEFEWNLSGGEAAVYNYLAHLIAEDLLCNEVYWPPLDELQPKMEQIPIAKVQMAQLENPCIGFECSLTRNGGKQARGAK